MKYLSIKELAESKDYPFTLGQIRSFLMDRKINGLSKCIRKIGRKLYIRNDLFDQWIDFHVLDENDSIEDINET